MKYDAVISDSYCIGSGWTYKQQKLGYPRKARAKRVLDSPLFYRDLPFKKSLFYTITRNSQSGVRLIKISR